MIKIRGKDLFYLMDKDSRRAEQPFRLLRYEGQYIANYRAMSERLVERQRTHRGGSTVWVRVGMISL